MTTTLPEFGHSSDYVPPIGFHELKGAALVIRPTGVASVTTSLAEHEVVVADMYVLDGGNSGHLEVDRKFFGSFLNEALRNVLDGGDGVIVARVNRGHFYDTRGYSLPFWYFQPVNLLTDKELLVQAEVVAKAQGWME